MKFRLFPRLLGFFFLLPFLQTAFAQSPANKIYYNFAGDGGATTRPRIFADAENSAPEKSAAVSNKTSAKIFDLEHRVFDLINQERAKAGLPSLVWNEDLARVARGHSQNMAASHFFSHTGLDGKMVNNRADAAGVKSWRLIGENIAYNRGFGDPTGCAVQNWMNSPGHRDNILKTDWRESGIGVAVTENGTYYFTQVFLLKR